MVAVCPAVIFADEGCEHGSFCSLPRDPLLVSMKGERPETWYVPGGSRTEKVPEVPTWTATCRWPAAVKVTVAVSVTLVNPGYPPGRKSRSPRRNTR